MGDHHIRMRSPRAVLHRKRRAIYEDEELFLHAAACLAAREDIIHGKPSVAVEHALGALNILAEDRQLRAEGFDRHGTGRALARHRKNEFQLFAGLWRRGVQCFDGLFCIRGDEGSAAWAAVRTVAAKEYARTLSGLQPFGEQCAARRQRGVTVSGQGKYSGVIFHLDVPLR